MRNGKIHVELLGKFGSSEELDRSNLNSIDRILPEVNRSKFPKTYFCKSTPEHPIRSFSMTKSSSPSDFRSRTHWFHDLGCL
jgi:hypothetical protein